MAEIRLKARRREAGKGPAHRSRREGWVPAILYGREAGSIPVQVLTHDLDRHLAAGLGTGTVVRVDVEDGERREWTAVLKEIQRDPVSLRVMHLDFQQVLLGDVLVVEIPVVVRGAEEVMRRGGIVQHQLPRVRIEAPVTAIPADIEVDVCGLGVGQHLTVADLRLPPGVRMAEKPDEVVITVLAPRREEEEKPAAEPAAGEAAAGERAGEGATPGGGT
ncbi:MAG: 50S ribosomal protein L25 [Bacillota bacterium]|nr:50S ribosomal protein L25 [Bacillota bacterium]